MQAFHLVHSFSRDPERTKGAKLERRTLRRVLRFAKPYRSQLTVFVLSIVALAIVEVIPPLLLRALIDTAIPNGDTAMLAAIVLVQVLVALSQGGLNLFQRWMSALIGEGLIFDLRTALFDHVQRMPISFFTRTQSGALISRLNNDVIGAQRALTGTLSTILSNAVTVVTTLIVMFALNWQITLLALLVLPVFVVTARWIGRRLQRITRESMNLDASMNAMMTERFNVAGAMLVKLFGRADRESEDFTGRAGKVRDIGVTSAMYTRGFLVGLSLIAPLVTAVLFWFGGNAVIDGTMEVGTLVALSIYLARLYTPLTSLTTARVDFLTAMVSFERVFEVLDLPHPIEDAADAQPIGEGGPVRGRVEFDGVTFRYPRAGEAVLESLMDGKVERDVETAPVLQNVSFSVDPGRMVALVGPSGAGKTTISMLVNRLYDVTDGAVRIDGHDVRDVTLDSLARAVGVVTQDPHLFHDSVRANLAFARPDAGDEDIEAACRAANIHHVIDSLPDGYDTLVGERGYRLSGGEKQRLAIARVFLKDPAIVILDEATSHLDAGSEALVQHALEDALSGRTSLVIAHRLSTIVASDEILVVVDGRIVESGPHTDLLSRRGVYADLFERQFQGADVFVDR